MSEEITTERFLNIHDVCHLTTLSRAQIHKMVSNSTFPAPVCISERRSAWRPADIRKWYDGLKKRGE